MIPGKLSPAKVTILWPLFGPTWPCGGKVAVEKSRHGASDRMPPVFSPVELRGRCPMAERLSAAGLRSKLPGRWV